MVASLLVTVWAGLAAAVEPPRPEEFQANEQPPAQKGSGSAGPKILAQSEVLPANLVPKQNMVIRSGKELADVMAPQDEAKATAAVAQALNLKNIDWSKQMLIVLSGGAQVRGGYKVEVKKMEVAKDVLTIHWKVKPPGPDEVAPQVLSHPNLLFLTERFPGTIQFEPAVAPPAPTRCCRQATPVLPRQAMGTRLFSPARKM